MKGDEHLNVKAKKRKMKRQKKILGEKKGGMQSKFSHKDFDHHKFDQF